MEGIPIPDYEVKHTSLRSLTILVYEISRKRIEVEFSKMLLSVSDVSFVSGKESSTKLRATMLMLFGFEELMWRHVKFGGSSTSKLS